MKPQPSPTAAPAPAGPTAAERLAAEEIVLSLWEDAAKVGFPARESLLAPLAMVNPARAEERLQSFPEGQRESPLRYLLWGLVQADPDAAVQRLVDQGTDRRALLRGVWLLAFKDPAAARRLLDVLLATPEGSVRVTSDRFEIAAAARILGDTRAADLVRQAVAAATEGVPPDGATDRALSLAAWSLALAAPEDALKLAGRISSEPERRRLLARLAGTLARTDPAQALAALEAFRPAARLQGQGLNLAWRDWAEAAPAVAAALAKRDAAAAAALARQVPEAGLQAEALAMVAASLPPEGALALRREALACALRVQDWQRPAALARVAELIPPGRERVDACALGMQVVDRQGTGAAAAAAQIAYSLAAVDADAARVLLAEVSGSLLPPEQNGWDACRALAVALAPLNPGQAAGMARRIPDEQRSMRVYLLRDIAFYLALPPASRAGIPFHNWVHAQSSLPGEDTLR